MNSDTNPAVVIIDNSISFTGAFKCALQQALLLSNEFRYIFVLPAGSTCITLAEEAGFRTYVLPMIEMRKDPVALVKYFPRLWANSSRLLKIIEQEKPSAILMNDFYNLLGALVKRRGAGVRLFTYVRFLPFSITPLLRNFWLKAAMRYADHIIAVSDAVKRQLPPNEKVKKIYDAAVLKEFHFNGELNKSEEVVELLYVGNYIRGKGQDLAIEAFARAYAIDPALRLRFAGGVMGLDKNRQFKLELERTASSRGLDRVIRFLPFESDTELLYKSADIVLNFSTSESFSMTCLEASFYGVPVIATRCGGPEEIIQHNITGLLVNNGDIESMTGAILRLAADHSLRASFSNASRQYIRTKFSPEKFQAEMHSLLSPNT